MDALVACPVCTLYLREGMSMSSHLDTHPKDQVIDALVRCMNPDRLLATASSTASSAPTIINPFQVVSEEHIIFGRHEVTNIIHAPLMSYPIYHQQQSVVSASSGPEFLHSPPSEQRYHELQMTVGSYSSQGNEQQQTQNNEMITPVISLPPPNHSNEYVDETPRPQPPEQKPCYDERGEDYENDADDDDDNGKEEIANYNSGNTPSHSPLSCHSAITVRTDLTHTDRDTDGFGASDFQDEDARHHEDLMDTPGRYFHEDVDDPIGDSKPHQEDEEMVDDVEARSDSGLHNIQADECLPPLGELSGHGSVTAGHPWQEEMMINVPGPRWTQVEPRRFTCLYCEEEFSSPKDRRLHVASAHCAPGDCTPVDITPGDSNVDVKDTVVCVNCGLQLPSPGELMVHIKNEHSKVTRTCMVCEEEFKTLTEFNDHILNVHPLECRTCGKTFHSKNGLLTHAKIHLEMKPHQCTLCPKSFVTKQKLKEHMNGHTGYCPIQCNMCDKKFRRYSNLKQHKNSVHFQLKKPSKEFFCECGETFISKKKLEWHQETHADKPKQCMYCSERYIHNASLTRHIRKAHNNEYLPPTSEGVKKKNVVCPVCNLTFVESSLRSHMKQHGQVKQFGCIVCGKRFFTKWNLNLHRWTHASRMSKPYKCSLCKSAFIRQLDLQAHIRSHCNSKPFTCNHCGMQFNRKHNWSRHEKEHLSEKKYTCNECGKSFHRNYYLVEHSRIHTGAKPYSCHICNKTSTTKSNHNKHIKTHHAREAINIES